MLRRAFLTAAAILIATTAAAQINAPKPSDIKTEIGRYATVNGLKMYYQVHGQAHGQGRPLVLLHGGLMTIEAMGPILPDLAKTRQVIAVELEGHGRTVDLDRPLSYEQMADDVAGLMKQLNVEQADIFGFSMGGATAMRIAARHPQLVRKLVVASAHNKVDATYASIRAMWPGLSPEALAGSPMEQVYTQTAPDPKRWPSFVAKLKQFMLTTTDWPDANVQAIKAPTLLLVGDADLIRPESMVDLFRLLGGARPDGGMGGVPASQLAVLPGVTHFNIIYRTDLLMPIVVPFLDGPMKTN